MARRGRRGSLSETTYFPSTGDELEDHVLGIVWKCAKANKYEHEGETFKYALLLGISSEFEGALPKAIHNDTTDYLEGIETIRRRIDENTVRIYDWSTDSGTWQQRMEED